MAVQPKISRLIGDAQAVNADTEVFYDRQAGEVHFFSMDTGNHVPEIAELREEIREDTTGRFVSLPSQSERNDYRVMKQFARSRADDRQRELLEVALRGRGAFGRFKMLVDELDIREAWFAFRDAHEKRLMMDWCEKHEVAYIDDMPDAEAALCSEDEDASSSSE